MTLIAWLVRIVIILLIVRFLVRMVSAARQAPGGRPGGPRPGAPERIGGTLVRDPQCGTYLPESRAIVVRSGGETQYFCSAACRDAYAGRDASGAPASSSRSAS